MKSEIRLIPYQTEEVLLDSNEVPKGIEMVQASALWEKGFKGKGITIALLDTGCDLKHPDLQGRVIGQRNFTEDDNGDSSIVTDRNGHGTHVAGTIAATENKVGVIGVAPEAELLIVKVLGGENGSGAYDWIINGIQYAIDQKVDVISMSLGGPTDNKALHGVIQKAVLQGISVVCAAGNEGDSDGSTDEFSYPGAYNEVISVGAVDLDRNSSYFTNSNNEVDLIAPGEKILSTFPGEKYAKLSGTSMAAPHTSGAIALIKQFEQNAFKRNLSEAELYAQLIKRTIPLGNEKTLEGNGFLYLIAPELLEEYLQDKAIPL
jgi:major intracellular serine protease